MEEQLSGPSGVGAGARGLDGEAQLGMRVVLLAAMAPGPTPVGQLDYPDAISGAWPRLVESGRAEGPQTPGGNALRGRGRHAMGSFGIPFSERALSLSQARVRRVSANPDCGTCGLGTTTRRRRSSWASTG